MRTDCTYSTPVSCFYSWNGSLCILIFFFFLFILYELQWHIEATSGHNYRKHLNKSQYISVHYAKCSKILLFEKCMRL